jgi:DNA polymerase III subunit alpha
MQKFTHLHVHSQFSILDGAAKIPALVSKAKEYGMDSLALTDHGSMFGIKKFFDECKAQEVKPILGCEVYIAPGDRTYKKSVKGEKHNFHLILLAKNKVGYHNLMKLVSQAWIDGYYYKPRIDKEILKQYSEGLIVSSACLGGEIPQLIMKNNIEAAEEVALWYKEVFGDDFYLEVMLHPIVDFNPNQNAFVLQSQVEKNLTSNILRQMTCIF